MGRSKITISNIEFENLYRKWKAGTITQRAMADSLVISKQTLIRRIKEYESKDPASLIINKVFTDPVDFHINPKTI